MTEAAQQLDTPPIPAEALTMAGMEARLLYSVIVAGKSAAFADAKIVEFFRDKKPGESPFDYIRRLIADRRLHVRIRRAKTGNYIKVEKAFRGIVAANFDLRTVSPEQLEKIHGIGPKSSRFFIMWIRPEERHAALDTHVLKWLRFIGHLAPKATPGKGVHYARLEKAFLAEADARGMTPRELDIQIWEWCQQGRHRDGDWPPELDQRPAA